MKNIHVLEDNDDIREVIEYLLIDSGYNFKGYENVASFYNALHGNLPDAFILDIMLPDGNGINICKELKSRLDTKNIPILMMSANTDFRDVKAKCMAEDFISKPFDIDDFVGRVDHLIQNPISS